MVACWLSLSMLLLNTTVHDHLPCGNFYRPFCHAFYFLIVPTAPRSLMVINITGTTVTLSWMSPDQPNGVIMQYQVEYRRSDSSDFISLDPFDADLTYTMTGLTSDTEYVFRVRAFTVVGDGPFSTEFTVNVGKYYIIAS